MQRNTTLEPLHPSAILMAQLKDLALAIDTMADYLQKPIFTEQYQAPPMGKMGAIMASQLVRETHIIEKSVYQLVVEDSNEAQACIITGRLHKNIAMLKALMTMIDALPGATDGVVRLIHGMSEKVITQCDSMDHTLEEVDQRSMISGYNEHIAGI